MISWERIRQDMFDVLLATINHLIGLSDEEAEMIRKSFSYRKTPKNHVLIANGEIARELFFINRGLIRLFYTKGKEEITGFIFKEHLFASSYESFLRATPSIQTLQTLEECELLVITHDELENLYEKIPSINLVTRKVAEQRFINSQQILSSFLLDSPEERYRKFEAQHRDIIQRVPQKIIASYLGITPVSLSRIRHRLMIG
jgi:CRP/FNR family transcriptional regulator, anaerobic regulatory protein